MPKLLSEYPIHLGLGAVASHEPKFTGVDWYTAYAERRVSDGSEGRLVSMHTFDSPWPHWEMHPNGHEVVVCTAGELTLLQEIIGQITKTQLRPGECAINPPGVWHTADVSVASTALFITAGLGTEHRPR